MGFMTINGRKVEFTDEKNVLTVIHKAGIELPTLCYHSELSIYGACRLCTVEDQRGKTFASCSQPPKEGMVIYTHTRRLMRYRKLIVEMLLAAHDRDCTICTKTGRCKLQEISQQLNCDEIRFENNKEHQPKDMSSPAIIRDPNKCILCGDCVRMCENIQHVNAIDFVYRGSDAMVTPAFNKPLVETDCVGCGQCRSVCPTGAITIHTNMEEVWDVIGDPNVKVVAQIAPAVRVAVGDQFGCEPGENVMGKLVAALHQMGFDEVYDTTYGADLTVVEESQEFLNRIANGGKLPLFTSCCPGWVKFAENKHPELVENISSCRSPQQMFGAVLREHFKDEKNSEGKRVVSVSIMPCTAKKEEIRRTESCTDGVQDIDYVLTTTEIISMIQRSGLNFHKLEYDPCDMPFGIGSGAGVIFGVTGGVTEAVLRQLMPGRSRSEMEAIKMMGVRGLEGVKEFSFNYEGRTIKAAVVSGLGNADDLIARMEAGEVSYDFIEVMACPRGCIMGGGQPVNLLHTKGARAQGLYKADVSTQIRRSSDNPMITELYEGILKGQEHHLLHRY